PAALVEWLREILPGKTTAELYMAIGCQKHAKTESYREYSRYVTTADEQFIEAPGIRGMVMLVFTLPGFDRVFKVIKDTFAPQKEMTAAHVRACYQLVKEHDRVGRMADTQEFENFVLDKQQIDPALMALLLQEAPAKITRSEEHTSELQSRENLVCRLLLEKKKKKHKTQKKKK